MVSIFYCVLVLAFCLVVPGRASVATLMPQPEAFSNGSNTVVLGSSFVFAYDNTDNSCISKSTLLSKAFTRYYPLVMPFGELATTTTDTDLNSCAVCVQLDSTTLQFGVDESYGILVQGTTCTITANTIWGAMRALETFSQLVDFVEKDAHVNTARATGSYAIAHTPIKITDAPRFPWRGMLLDSARHYLPMFTLYSLLDAMEYNKFNVMHWHIIDAQAFPFVSESFPELSTAGAYHPRAIYSPANVSAIVQYALERGIRVVPEFDGPGHAAAMGKGYEEVTAKCPTLSHNINNIPLSPASATTFRLLEGLYADAAALFIDDYIHLGGDEVVESCWNKDADVVNWMEGHNMNSTGLYQFFMDNMTAIAKQNDFKVINWNDPVQNGVTLSKDTTIEVWNADGLLSTLAKQGYKVINAGAYYLDQQQPNATNTYYSFMDTWEDFYMADPAENLSGDAANRVLGGEATMWGETITPHAISSYIYPRAIAIAERFWSSKSVNDVTDAQRRMGAQSCRMLQRGIVTGELVAGFCLTPEYFNY